MKFKVGDKVVVTRRANDRESDGIGWIGGEMDARIGKSGTIRIIEHQEHWESPGAKIIFDDRKYHTDYWFPEPSLAPLKRLIVLPKRSKE